MGNRGALTSLALARQLQNVRVLIRDQKGSARCLGIGGGGDDGGDGGDDRRRRRRHLPTARIYC